MEVWERQITTEAEMTNEPAEFVVGTTIDDFFDTYADNIDSAMLDDEERSCIRLAFHAGVYTVLRAIDTMVDDDLEQLLLDWREESERFGEQILRDLQENAGPLQ
jgi:hypothetical protein